MEVPEGVRWDRKRSPEPNLHMCGEDDMKRAIYNMKGKHAGKGSEHKKRHKEHSGKKLKNQRTILVSKKN